MFTTQAGIVLALTVALGSPLEAVSTTPTPLPASGTYLVNGGHAREAREGRSGATLGVPYEKLANRWLEEHGVEVDAPESVQLDKLIEDHFVHATFGSLRLHFPAWVLTDSSWGPEFNEVLRNVATAHGQWVRWEALPEDLSRKQLESQWKRDKKAIDKWIATWKVGDLEPVSAGMELFQVLEPKKKVAEAFANMDAWGKGRETSDLVLLPTREEFLQFASLVGWAKKDLRDVYWAENLGHWTDLDFDGVRAACLEFSAGTPDYTQGSRMNERDPLGLVQHVVQLGFRSLLDHRFEDRIDPVLAGGLANMLVLDVYDQLVTRTDGDLRERSTSAQSVFIPGVQAKGGFLPPINADSHWRAGSGKNYFIPNLRANQKKAGKVLSPRSEQPKAFELLNDSGVERLLIKAPFFAVAGDGTPPLPPEDFQGDYFEFLRAYRVAFLHWLREEGASKQSHEAFASLCATLAQPHSGLDLEGAVQKIYGAPLSSTSADDDVLEGRFLIWLSKQR